MIIFIAFQVVRHVVGIFRQVSLPLFEIRKSEYGLGQIIPEKEQ